MSFFKLKNIFSIVVSVTTIATCTVVAAENANATRLSWASINVYASKWGKDRNDYYSAYKGSDCTNYVSQVIYTGGAKQCGGPGSNSQINGNGAEYTNSEWYFTKCLDKNAKMVSRWSSTWTVVEDYRGIPLAQYGLNPFLKKKVKFNERVSYCSNFATKYNIQAGDIIQIDKDNNNVCEHSIVVIHVDGNTIYYSGHDNDTIRDTFANAAARTGQKATYTVFHTSAGF